MAAPRDWTDAEIERLREINGSINADILKLEFGVCRSCLIQKERKLGIRRRKREPKERRPVKGSELPPFPRDHNPLPAGHPESWGLLTRGTVLDGTPYPESARSLVSLRSDRPFA